MFLRAIDATARLSHEIKTMIGAGLKQAQSMITTSSGRLFSFWSKTKKAKGF